jgi:hypothetical protein
MEKGSLEDMWIVLKWTLQKLTVIHTGFKWLKMWSSKILFIESPALYLSTMAGRMTEKKTK